jgi:hypothetical protein
MWYRSKRSNGIARFEWLLKDVRFISKSETSQNRYSAQTFIYLRKDRIDHGKRVFFGVAQKLPHLPEDA